MDADARHARELEMRARGRACRNDRFSIRSVATTSFRLYVEGGQSVHGADIEAVAPLQVEAVQQVEDAEQRLVLRALGEAPARLEAAKVDGVEPVDLLHLGAELIVRVPFETCIARGVKSCRRGRGPDRAAAALTHI